MLPAALLVQILSVALVFDGETARPEIGSVVAPFEFLDVRFARHGLEDFGKKAAFVLYFTTCDCPLASRYLPRLAELERRVREQGVQFVAVNVGAGDTVVDMGTQALDYDLSFPFVKDLELAVARAVGAERAGEVVLLDGERRLRYRGRVDGQYRVGGEGPPGRADLAEALAELLAGKAVSVAETRTEGCLLGAPPAPLAGLTYGKEVAPLLAQHCVECHREGGDAPFALLDYADAADHAAAIAEVVASGRMPPWHASATYGEFKNRRALDAATRRVLVDWARTGAAAGALSAGDSLATPSTKRLPPIQDSAWKIGVPDLVLETPTEMHLPADGLVPYQYTVLPFVFLADTWVEALQIVPRNRRAMHHCNLAHVRLGEEFKTENFITGQVPGGDPMELEPGIAVLIPKGSLLGLQIHYVTTGKEESDRISVGLRFPRTPVIKRERCLQIYDTRFAIPPGAPAFPIQATRSFPADAIGIGMYIHMHKRGRDMRFSAIAPDGGRETLLLVPSYDFDWQASYRWFPGAQRFPKGTKVECLAHFDNSPFNPWNPDPTATVRFGLQTAQEMMYGFLFYVDADEQLDLNVDPKSGHALGG